MIEGFVHKVVRSHVRADATRFSDGTGLSGIAWSKGRRLVYLAVDPDGRALCGTLDGRGGMPDGRDVARDVLLRTADGLGLSHVMEGAPAPVPERCTDPEVLELAARFAAVVDEGAVRAMVARGVPLSGSAYAFCSGASDVDARASLCAEYGWASVVMAGRPVPRKGGPEARDALVEACRDAARRAGGALPRMTAEYLVACVGGMTLPEGLAEDMPRVLAAAATLTGPGPGSRLGDPVEALAMLHLAHLAACYSDAAGTPLGKVVPGIRGDWIPAMRTLAVRANMPEFDEWEGGPPDAEDEDGWDEAGYSVDDLAADLVHDANDMVSAFEAQVVVPALAESGASAADIAALSARGVPGRLGGRPWRDGRPDPSTGAVAFRLLARGKSLPGFLEEVASWHANQDDIARVALAATGEVRWTEAFRPWTSRGGFSLSCISDSTTLRAEALAMDNCVSTYLDRCRSSRCVLVAARRGGKSVGTIEIVEAGGVPVLRQVAGPRNAVPTKGLSRAAHALIAAIRGGEVVLAEGALDPRGEAVPLTYVGHYAAMRDAWAPHLARGVRKASSAALLASAAHPTA